MKLLTIGNPKTAKGEKRGFITFILHLAPATESGYNTCPKASEGCKQACLNKAGRGGMFKKGESTNMIQKARIRKTKMFFENREAFMDMLHKDILCAIKYAKKRNLTAVFRLNGTSDLSWEKYEMRDGKTVFQLFPDVQFYDYTKVLGRKVKSIPNYHLTFSRAESNEDDVTKALTAGYNVACVFKILPIEYYRREVINGDDSDLRFLDKKGVVVGLKAKGPAKRDQTGFVIQ